MVNTYFAKSGTSVCYDPFSLSISEAVSPIRYLETLLQYTTKAASGTLYTSFTVPSLSVSVSGSSFKKLRKVLFDTCISLPVRPRISFFFGPVRPDERHIIVLSHWFLAICRRRKPTRSRISVRNRYICQNFSLCGRVNRQELFHIIVLKWCYPLLWSMQRRQGWNISINTPCL